MYGYLSIVLAMSGTIAALLAPIVIIAVLATRGRNKWWPLLLFVLFFVLDIALVFIFKIVHFIPAWGGMNWQGKILEIAFVLILVATVPVFTVQSVGLQFRTEPGSWRIFLIVSVFCTLIIIPLVLFLSGWQIMSARASRLIYEATVPGLGEEFMYRGVLLMLLNRAFGKQWKLLGAPVGWGFVIVTFLFAFLHGIEVKSFTSVHIYWTAMIYPLIIGAILAWLRERTGSLWPGVVLHNLVNVLSTVYA